MGIPATLELPSPALVSEGMKAGISSEVSEAYDR